MFLNSFLATSFLYKSSLNRKHEMFLNKHIKNSEIQDEILNCKHEMFLNSFTLAVTFKSLNLTVNMKCF